MRPPALAAASSGSTACRPISSFSAPTTNSRIEILPPCAKNGRTRRSGSTPTTRDVSTVPSGERGQAAVEHALAGERRPVTGARSAGRMPPPARAGRAGRSVISSASISFRPRPKRCGASRLSGRVATSPPESRRAARTAVARGAAVGHAGADREIGADVAAAVVGQRTLAFGERELALEELAAAPDRAKRIARDDERRRLGRVPVAAIGADLLLERLGDPFVRRVGRLDAIDELRHRRTASREEGCQRRCGRARKSDSLHDRSLVNVPSLDVEHWRHQRSFPAPDAENSCLPERL